MHRLILACGLLLIVFSASAANAQTTLLQVQVFDTRADLEVLADEFLGTGNRPSSWVGNIDVNSPSLVTDLWFDNEQLADLIFGPGQRPRDWIGATVPTADILARNVRHDLELSADEFFGLNQRPDLWRGSPQIVRCQRELQNIVTVLNTFYAIQSEIPESTLNYCPTLLADLEAPLYDITFNEPNIDGETRDPIALLSAVRGDLERLADELLGLNTRPAGWVGNRDATSATLIGDIFLDTELLADDLLGAGVRPDGYIPAISNDPAVASFSLRYNVELLADATLTERFGQGFRPAGWQGAEEPFSRCEPLLRNLQFLVEENFPLDLQILDPAAPNYCQQVANIVNGIVENPPVLDVVEEDRRLRGTSNFAFSYLDVDALEYMGIMPGGTEFRAVYRNYSPSNMMFVTGDNFAVFIDRNFTDFPETTFNSLPTIENREIVTFCDARWCNGPAPTPTPTGSGALFLVLVDSTPVEAPDPEVLTTEKQLVSWNFIRVSYALDNVQTGRAQVTLAICPSAAAVLDPTADCQPVTSVFDNNTGVPVPVITQLDGLNVYELSYGYSTNLVIESAAFFSNDVWISDPTIR